MDFYFDLACPYGFDPSYVAAAVDEKWDAEIGAQWLRPSASWGPRSARPILVLSDDVSAAISGPVVSPGPTGEEALTLWDHVAGLACSLSFYELKRTRTGPPQL